MTFASKNSCFCRHETVFYELAESLIVQCFVSQAITILEKDYLLEPKSIHNATRVNILNFGWNDQKFEKCCSTEDAMFCLNQNSIFFVFFTPKLTLRFLDLL